MADIAPPAWTDTGAKRAESSLPTPEEAQTDAMIRNVNGRLYRGRKKFLYLVGAAVVVLVVIIGLVAGLSNQKKASGSNALRSNGGEGGGEGTYVGPWESSVDTSQPRVQETFAFLSKWVDQATLEGDTPQRAAALWISGIDPRAVDVPPVGANYDESFVFAQRWILGVFWYALGGFDWKEQMEFMSHLDVCEWNYDLDEASRPEYVDPGIWKFGVQCDEQGSVSFIRITENNLRGELPHELGLLVAMNHFSVFGNEISGELPESLQFWTNLDFLAAEGNNLTGRLPSWINKWTKLEYMALGHNNFGGSFPSFSELQMLREVSLQHNEFVGGIDVFNDCLVLEALYLNDNNLDGAISMDTYVNLSLRAVDLSNNDLTGIVPNFFFNFEIVALHNNQIGGDFPNMDFEDEVNIRFFSVFNNQIGGQLPPDINVLQGLTHLDVSNNQISGPIPSTIVQLADLRYLYLGNNPFTQGEFPDIWAATNLEEIVLRNTQRTGTLPPWIGAFTGLVLLDVADNDMDGVLPDELGSLTELQFLFLNRNNFGGELPDSMINLRDLDIAMFDNNGFEGTVGDMCTEGVGQVSIDKFITDCVVECECCSSCCEASDTTCNTEVLVANVKSGYERDQFVFSEDVIYNSNSEPEE